MDALKRECAELVLDQLEHLRVRREYMLHVRRHVDADDEVTTSILDATLQDVDEDVARMSALLALVDSTTAGLAVRGSGSEVTPEKK